MSETKYLKLYLLEIDLIQFLKKYCENFSNKIVLFILVFDKKNYTL